jgi:hypothetical protein
MRPRGMVADRYFALDSALQLRGLLKSIVISPDSPYQIADILHIDASVANAAERPLQAFCHNWVDEEPSSRL